MLAEISNFFENIQEVINLKSTCSHLYHIINEHGYLFFANKPGLQCLSDYTIKKLFETPNNRYIAHQVINSFCTVTSFPTVTDWFLFHYFLKGYYNQFYVMM